VILLQQNLSSNGFWKKSELGLNPDHIYNAEKGSLFWQVLPNKTLLSCWRWKAWLGLFFYPEDGGDMFLRNVGGLSTD
jgi:hypothetical protein